MRVLVIGGSLLGKLVAKSLIEAGHEVVVVEKDEELVEEIAGELDCLAMAADPTLPNVLHEAGVEEADVVVVVGDDDHENIISAILAHRLSDAHIVVKLDDPRYNQVLLDINVNDIVNPVQQTLMQILHLVSGAGTINISRMIRGKARALLVKVPPGMKGKKLEELKLPNTATVAAVYRGDTYIPPKTNPTLQPGDELLIITSHEDVEDTLKYFIE